MTVCWAVKLEINYVLNARQGQEAVMSMFQGAGESIRKALADRRIRIRELEFINQANELEAKSSSAMRAAEAAIDSGEMDAAERLLKRESELSYSAGELRLQASNLRGAL